mmetsp:Transcript_2061/g.3711  ORF Transcript_2061/g.3711 Transcript_2061/m.3711 type:complete len:569 (+) Transcript_2061:237-1943(+)|eukprot:CAMPEP_0182500592 /NCGR_PEP_ID=MMETSP1321-20130603/9653_1 /TAXON_ID=91990 /ORGANISM="Bolidomonas sp., Strain RCC1657" /LENGTH=568 /DNA_ID=CAMNT_0024705075 /DNA_START=179 /DNA_END=1888 /DNA_ORIENTATION=+
MSTFTSYERVHTYSGPIKSSPPRRRSEAHSDEYTDEDDLLGRSQNSTGKSRNKQPKNAKMCYVMDGGGVTLVGDTTTNGGKIRLKEYDHINEENLWTMDRLSNIKSTLPKSRKSKKPGGVIGGRFERRMRIEKQKLAEQNKKLTSALNSIYRSKARLREHGVKKKDCRKIWSKRTGIYDMAKPSNTRNNTGVPKTAGMVGCGGCGLKTFYGADGLSVHQGSHGNMDSGHLVFYCNDVCAAVDWEINRENINKQNEGKGRKPLRKANYWVQSQAATAARKMLRKAVERGELPDLDAIMHEIKVQRGLGRSQSIAIAKTLPQDEKKDGMTGTARAKDHIIEGAKFHTTMSSYPKPDIWHGKEPPRGTTKEQIAREKAQRYKEDVREVERIVREGNNVGKGTVDKNAPSKQAAEKAPNPKKYKGGSSVSIGAEAGSGAAFEDKKEMYKSSAAIQREKDAKAGVEAQENARRANRGKAKKAQQRSKAEYDGYNETEEKRGGKFNIKTKSRAPPKKVSFIEKPAAFNGLDYDATTNRRNEEKTTVAEPKQSVVLAEEDPSMFRQSMDSIKLSR